MERDQNQQLVEDYIFQLINSDMNFELAADEIIKYSQLYSYEVALEIKLAPRPFQNQEAIKQQTLPRNSVTSLPKPVHNQNINGPLIIRRQNSNGIQSIRKF